MTEVVTTTRTYEDLVAEWHRVEGTANWIKGDLAAEVITVHGAGKLQEFAAEVETPFNTVEELRRVAVAFPENSRRLDIPWSVHQALASLDDRAELITGWTGTVAEARQLVKSRYDQDDDEEEVLKPTRTRVRTREGNATAKAKKIAALLAQPGVAEEVARSVDAWSAVEHARELIEPEDPGEDGAGEEEDQEHPASGIAITWACASCREERRWVIAFSELDHSPGEIEMVGDVPKFVCGGCLDELGSVRMRAVMAELLASGDIERREDPDGSVYYRAIPEAEE